MDEIVTSNLFLQQKCNAELIENKIQSNDLEAISENISLELSKPTSIKYEQQSSGKKLQNEFLQQDSKTALLQFSDPNNLNDTTHDDSFVEISKMGDKNTIKQTLNQKPNKNKTVVDLVIILIERLTLLKCQDAYLEDELPGAVVKTRGFIILFVAAVYISDVWSDIVLGVMYVKEGETKFAVITLFYVIGPSLISNIGNPDSTWKSKKYHSWGIQYKIIWWITWPLYIMFNFEPMYEYWRNFKLVKEYTDSKDKECRITIARQFGMSSMSVAGLRYIETVYEGWPQFILQLYLLKESDLATGYRLISIFTSVLSIAVTFIQFIKIYVDLQYTTVLLKCFLYLLCAFRVALIGVICPLEFSWPYYFSIHCLLLTIHILYEGFYWYKEGPAGYTTLPLSLFAAACFTIMPDCISNRHIMGSVLLTVIEDVFSLLLLTRYHQLSAIIHLVTFSIYICVYKFIQLKYPIILKVRFPKVGSNVDQN